MIKLSPAQARLLGALENGFSLKSHRYLDGAKVYRLHPLDGPAEPVDRAVVEALQERRLIQSNQKFPTATYLLTPAGKELAALLPDA